MAPSPLLENFQNLSDLDFDISRSLKIKSGGAVVRPYMIPY